MFFYYFFLLFLFYFILNSLTQNILVWWRVFIIITLSFVFLHKVQGDFSNSLNYFIIQEFLGFLFLICLGLTIQLLIFFIKVGVSPLHFWIFSVLRNVENYLLIWFLTVQKLPFLPVILYLIKFIFFFLIILGILFCYFHLFIMKNYKFILTLSSTESFNWIVIGLIIGIWGFFFIRIYYFINIILLINYQVFGQVINYYLEFRLVFINIPLSFAFFLKIFIMSLGVIIINFIALFLITIIILSSLSFIGWLVTYSTRVLKKFQDQINIIIIMFFVFFVIIFFFHFSKNIILLW